MPAKKKKAATNDPVKAAEVVSDDTLIAFECDDPFIVGSTRAYRVSISSPFELKITDKDAIDILASYIFRAKGGSRYDLAGLAETALQKQSKIVLLEG